MLFVVSRPVSITLLRETESLDFHRGSRSLTLSLCNENIVGVAIQHSQTKCKATCIARVYVSLFVLRVSSVLVLYVQYIYS